LLLLLEGLSDVKLTAAPFASTRKSRYCAADIPHRGGKEAGSDGMIVTTAFS
jgi:hypothetical protein